MRISIPVEVPPEDRDGWCRAFRAGYLNLKFPSQSLDELGLEELMYLVDRLPDAYQAGQKLAYQEMSGGRRR
jgi:hypothetical protein